MFLILIMLVSNIGVLIFSIIGVIESLNEPDAPVILFFIIILAIINICFIIGARRGTYLLYLKRKKLEEEIKIQEAKNKLSNLQSQISDPLKTKNENEII